MLRVSGRGQRRADTRARASMVGMIKPRVVHTAYLRRTELAGIRALLDRAFEGRFDDSDFDHSLGGLHVVVAADGIVVAHAAVVQRRLLHGQTPARAGYVEGVGVDPASRGRGYANVIMDEVERIVRAGYDVGALSASAGVGRWYAARGWLAWRGRTCVLGPAGTQRTPEDDDSTFVLPVPGGLEIDLAGMLACDWRDGDVW